MVVRLLRFALKHFLETALFVVVFYTLFFSENFAGGPLLPKILMLFLVMILFVPINAVLSYGIRFMRGLSGNGSSRAALHKDSVLLGSSRNKKDRGALYLLGMAIFLSIVLVPVVGILETLFTLRMGEALDWGFPFVVFDINGKFIFINFLLNVAIYAGILLAYVNPHNVLARLKNLGTVFGKTPGSRRNLRGNLKNKRASGNTLGKRRHS